MKRIALVIGLTLALAGTAAAQTLQDILRQNRIRSQQRQNQLWQSIQRNNRPRKPIDWRDYLAGPMPAWKVRELERSNRATHRNFYTATGCHKYNRGCANALRGLGD